MIIKSTHTVSFVGLGPHVKSIRNTELCSQLCSSQVQDIFQFACSGGRQEPQKSQSSRHDTKQSKRTNEKIYALDQVTTTQKKTNIIHSVSYCDMRLVAVDQGRVFGRNPSASSVFRISGRRVSHERRGRGMEFSEFFPRYVTNPAHQIATAVARDCAHEKRALRTFSTRKQV